MIQGRTQAIEHQANRKYRHMKFININPTPDRNHYLTDPQVRRETVKSGRQTGAKRIHLDDGFRSVTLHLDVDTPPADLKRLADHLRRAHAEVTLTHPVIAIEFVSRSSNWPHDREPLPYSQVFLSPGADWLKQPRPQPQLHPDSRQPENTLWIEPGPDWEQPLEISYDDIARIYQPGENSVVIELRRELRNELLGALFVATDEPGQAQRLTTDLHTKQVRRLGDHLFLDVYAIPHPGACRGVAPAVNLPDGERPGLWVMNPSGRERLLGVARTATPEAVAAAIDRPFGTAVQLKADAKGNN